MGRPATVLEASPAMRWLVVAAAAGALAGGAATAGRAVAVAKGKLALSIVTTVVKAKLIVAATVFRAAPCTTTFFPEHPHVEGREAVVLEVEGAPPAQVARGGANVCQPRVRAKLPTAEISTAAHGP